MIEKANPTIALLLSGGVDSAVAAYRLLEQGFGAGLSLFYIRIGLDTDEGDCPSDEDIEICRMIARRFKLPFEVVSLHNEYWDYVMEYALRTVRSGLTPNPDIMCNRIIKFGFFTEKWGKYFDYIASGHYARTKVNLDDGLKYLVTAVDPVKDQTDFLARITYDQLSKLVFPIGDIPKRRVREIAVEQKLPNAYRRDSQGICFLGNINYSDFIYRHLGELPGPIVEMETGRILGTHRGYWFHTIGQRKGLGLSGRPWFVVSKEVETNTLYVSRGVDCAMQYGTRILLTEMHWITRNPWEGIDCIEAPIAFKNRHSPEFIQGTLTSDSTNRWIIKSSQPVQGIAPGQFAVIYTPDNVFCLGSGVIASI